MLDTPPEPQVRMSFPKTSRLLKKLEYRRVLDNGTKVVGPKMVVFALRRESSPRLGLIVSRKVGNSVTRNAVKRCIRETFRQHDKIGPWDLVIIARPPAAQASFRQIAGDFTLSLNKLARKLQFVEEKKV